MEYKTIRKVCLKWRKDKVDGYCPVTSLIDRLQRAERNERKLTNAGDKVGDR